MPGARDALCHQALQLLAELCARGALEHDSCQDFIYHLRDRSRPRLRDPDISVSLLTLVVTACGLALFGVSLFVSWKLCWVPWRERGLFSGSKDNNQEPLNYTDTETNEQENSEDFLDPPTPCPDSSMKISHTSPDIPLSTQPGGQENCAHAIRVQRQVTEPTPSARHNSIRRQLNLSNPDFNIQQLQRQEQLTGIGRIKPELYKQRSLDNEDGRRGNSKACGKLNFILKYDCDLEQLIVKIHKAVNLPAKDFSGTSDPYVKIYLLPDRKTKHQTKVHRKTLNPVFDEVFLFPVPYNDLEARKLHFSVYDFDRFSRHDLIGQVVVDHFFDLADFPRECILWKDIEYVTNDNVDLGELMFSLCYLPTAGRLTITIIKARNLKAMDITGASDPYVKVSLMCDGRRLKKRKTSTKRNTLNPIYNEAIVFDVPPESIDQIHLSIAVMDYDRVGHNEVIGVCQVGNEAERLGRDHWSEMLSYPRKPIAHWHSLMEEDSRSSAQCLTVDLYICFPQLLDRKSLITIRVVTNLITVDGQFRNDDCGYEACLCPRTQSDNYVTKILSNFPPSDTQMTPVMKYSAVATATTGPLSKLDLINPNGPSTFFRCPNLLCSREAHPSPSKAKLDAGKKQVV